MVMPAAMPISLSAGGGGPSGSSSNAGVMTPISNPFNFDGSGWVVNFGGSNTTTAKGNEGANQTDQTQTPSGAGSLASSLGLGSVDPMLLLLGVGAFLLLRKKS
jgi:hypothetical protein